jgi:MSHA biogenesis protein MshP
MRRPVPPPFRRAACGFGLIAVIIVLVMLAALAAAVVRLGSGLGLAAAQDQLSARANWAAASGTQWGAYQALKGAWTQCSGDSQTLDLSADSGMWVTVSCQSTAYSEGESAPGTPRTVRVWTLTATACNSAAGCPDAAAVLRPSYVERVRQMTLAQ